MSTILGLILCVVSGFASVHAQFNPRFQPPSLPPAPFGSQQRSLSAFAELNGYGLPQMPSAAFSSSRLGYGSGPPPPMSPYGSPLFGGAGSSSSGDPYQSMMMGPEQMMMAMMQQQPIRRSPPPFGQQLPQGGPMSYSNNFNSNMPPPQMGPPSPPPPFGAIQPTHSLLQQVMMPVGGRSPFQRTPGMEMGAGSSGDRFRELEPFMASEDAEPKKEESSSKTSD